MSDWSGLEIAVIGMAGRFAGAESIDDYWRLIRTGTDSIRRFSTEELTAAGVDETERRRPDHVPVGGAMDGAELFDASFFGYTPRDAAVLDPQQRVFLECAWHALEDAGYGGEPDDALVGVYAGASLSTYLLRHLLADEQLTAELSEHELVLSNDKDTLATRVAYHMDLRGPAVTVQTGCSTSLVAIHLAAQALVSRDCDIALAGGVSIRLPQTGGYRYQEGGILSPDGHCRAFDAEAQGTVGGNGVGVVVLKPLADALRDGDTVHAVIRGSAINNDGRGRIGFTAPGIDGQAAVVRAAHEVADVDPATIGYVEAHGTGTPLGDPIEVAALSQAFRAGAPDGTGWCALGSVKTVIGHLDAAAGVAGFVKAVLAVREGLLPPSPYFTAPNPELDLGSTPFHVPTEPRPWRQNDHPRRAGVSSFSMGGTNAHVVLEQPPAPVPAEPTRPHEVLLLSAQTEAALAEAADRLSRHLGAQPDIALGDVAYTLMAGRRPFPYRMAVVAADPAEAAQRLRAGAPAAAGVAQTDGRDVVFLFPGQGSQYPGMATGLYDHEPAFRRHLDECAELLRPHLDADLRDVLRDRDTGAGDRLAQTCWTQPALFAVEYALARLWLGWGITPRAMLGHSVGEYVAACLASTMDLPEALRLVTARGRLMQRMPAGAMLSVALSAEEAAALADALGGELALSVSNGPDLSVLSGPVADIERAEAELTRMGLAHRRLHTSHAFHSPMMDPILDEFADLVSTVRLRPPRIPFVSNVTGAPITADQATEPRYWARQLRQPVQFSEGVRALLGTPEQVLLEVGPGATLTGLARRHDLGASGHTAVNSLPRVTEQRADTAALAAAAGRLWTSGVTLNADALAPGRRRISLPGYPFARQRHWVDLPSAPPVATAADVAPVAAPATADAQETLVRITEIWQRLLGIPGVGPHDDFFELGGHSLLVTQIVARIHDELGVQLAPAAVFEMPTIALLAAEVDRIQAAAAVDLSELLAELEMVAPDELQAELDLLRGSEESRPS
ncbi:type I polyketide synthase [Couchioplanes caeruleus]|uniref:Modular polyketide synthase n=2 Tax=Couchioplanes caeruleus TaxID=56438 RepID=A0A1K0GEV3_9ACTN|nr:type I polyketide synthase [Couchioplanes caeruleus]OJF15770.1 Modular polyketide synthase [Couchioplanes caeruleus subsp. caeruleus]ROP31259.1 acyl transferase domain-containing protein [Couchioplanes caeruleus]